MLGAARYKGQQVLRYYRIVHTYLLYRFDYKRNGKQGEVDNAK